MKSTKDNKSAIKFSDIVKELHSYANSEKAIDDFSSELLKIANLPEEFDLSLSYFGDDKAKNYLRKKTNLKNMKIYKKMGDCSPFELVFACVCVWSEKWLIKKFEVAYKFLTLFACRPFYKFLCIFDVSFRAVFWIYCD